MHHGRELRCLVGSTAADPGHGADRRLGKRRGFPRGMTTNTFRVTDASGNTATCSFTVTITDTELPTITCPANITGNNDPGQCSKMVSFTAPVDCGQLPRLCHGADRRTRKRANAYAVGMTTNTFRVTDAAGNTATCSFTVTISDTESPCITCPTNVMGTNDNGQCSRS
ncbi:MAG: HYR domain-containing protein [Bacteroidia bacterium]